MATDRADVQLARVLTTHGNHGLAEVNGDAPLPFSFRRSLTRPLPGDQIELDAQGQLSAVLPRHNEFGRGDRHGRFRASAANVDQMLIVIAAEPAPSADLVHRYLTLASLQSIVPIIVINKTDLPTPASTAFDDLADLEALGYRILRVRCQPTPELGELTELLDGRISVLAGQSGVGKTSLTNALVPDHDHQVGALSTATGKGVHTTSTATLIRLPNRNGWLLDTPGVWEYSLWRMSPNDLIQGFPELANWPERCRFRDCRHGEEPGCAIRQAVEAGQLPASRWRAWQRLLKEQGRLAQGG